MQKTIARLTPETIVHDLLDVFPFLIEELGDFNHHYTMLRNPQMREKMARAATLEIAAARGGVTVDDLMQFIAGSVQKHTGRTLMMDVAVSQGVNPERLEAFRRIMVKLHDGGDIKEAEREFAEIVKVTAPGEIAEMEQHLIREGISVSEIKRMCDTHLQIVKPTLQPGLLNVPAGHPVHTYLSENQLIERSVGRLRAFIDATGNVPHPVKQPEAWAGLAACIERLWEIDKHYLRKEHQLFSYLERKGFTGPSQVMWAVQDDIRAQLKSVRKACASGDASAVTFGLPPLLNAVSSMIQKEESILLPTALQLLSEEDWIAIKGGEKEIGYMEGFVPGTEWDQAADGGANEARGGLLEMNVGQLTPDQVNLMLTHLPVELSFVDEHDTVRYYSNQPHKIFARTPDAIGRKVQNCHPPKSVHLVNQILADFRSGKRDVADFWIEFNKMFVYIRYFAVRDAAGGYRGSLEVVQDVSHIRGLKGERRLLAEEA